MNHLFAPIKYLAIFPLFNRVQMHNQNQWEVNRTTFASYLEYLGDAFIIDRAERYDIKGKKYIDSPYKYYFTDNGLQQCPFELSSDRTFSSYGEYNLQ